MQQFEHYYKEIIYINGIKTCIVSQEYLNEILEDSELLDFLFKGMSLLQNKKIFEYLINEAKSNPAKIFLAFAQHSVKNPYMEDFSHNEQSSYCEYCACPNSQYELWRINNKKRSVVWWEPVNCYKEGNFYYHVYIRDNWLCRECKQVNYDKFIMPISEHDATFYSDTDNKYPNISSLFVKKKCSYCGRELQNHFLKNS